jgi:hypothetical protein
LALVPRGCAVPLITLSFLLGVLQSGHYFPCTCILLVYFIDFPRPTGLFRYLLSLILFDSAERSLHFCFIINVIRLTLQTRGSIGSPSHGDCVVPGICRCREHLGHRQVHRNCQEEQATCWYPKAPWTQGYVERHDTYEFCTVRDSHLQVYHSLAMYTSCPRRTVG